MLQIINSAKKTLRGEEKLWIVFWGWFILSQVIFSSIRFVLATPFYNYLFRLPSPLVYVNIATLVEVVFAGLVCITLIISVWRCTKNVLNKFWGYLAKVIIVIFAVLTVYGFMLNISDIVVRYRAITNPINKKQGQKLRDELWHISLDKIRSNQINNHNIIDENVIMKYIPKGTSFADAEEILLDAGAGISHISAENINAIINLWGCKNPYSSCS